MSDPLQQFFTFNHLRDETMREVSKTFTEHVQRVLELCPDNVERHAAIRKMLEAKDCAVRSLVFKPQAEAQVVVAVFAADKVPDPKPTAPG